MGYLLTTCTQILDPRYASRQRVTIFSKSSPHESLLLQRGSRGKGAAAPFPCTPNPRLNQAFAPRTFSVDDAEHFLHNHHASVASLRLLFTFAPERRSGSLRNRCFTFTGIPTPLRAGACAKDAQGWDTREKTLLQGILKTVHF